MGIELIELKRDGSCCKFILRETMMNRLLVWPNLPDTETVKKYLKKHPFPKDKYCTEAKFLQEIENNNSYIQIIVETPENAGVIREVCRELLIMKIASSLK